MIAVVTGARSSRGQQSSFALAGRLMDEVFLSWETVVAVRQGDPAGEVPVQRGMTPVLQVVAGGDVRALVPRGEEAAVQWTLQPVELRAPVAQGDTVGTIVVLQGEEEVGRVAALAGASVERRPWWRFWGG